MYFIKQNTFNQNDLDKNWLAIHTLLTHNDRYNYIDFYIETYKNVNNGSFDARRFVSNLQKSAYSGLIVDFCQNSYGYVLNDDFYIYSPPSKEVITDSNKKRAKLYLEDVDSFHNKNVWQFRQDSVVFQFNPNLFIQITASYFFNQDNSNKNEKKQKRNDSKLYLVVLVERDYFNFKQKNYYKNSKEKRTLKKEAREYFNSSPTAKQELKDYKLLLNERRKTYWEGYYAQQDLTKELLK